MAQYNDQFLSKYPALLLPLRLETKFVPTNTGKELWLRIFPDAIAVNRHRPNISREEANAGLRFWDACRKKPNDRPTALGAWRVLAAAFGPHRGAWIAERTRNYVPPANPPVNPPVRTEVMPDYYEIRLYSADGKSVRTEKITNASPGLILDTNPNASSVAETLPAWITNFAAGSVNAISLGVGKKIPLTQAEWNAGFSKIVVLGLNTYGDTPDKAAANGKSLVENLFLQHRYSLEGLSVMPPGTPTNNTSSGAADYDPRPDPDDYFDAAMGTPLFTPTSDTAQKTDGQRLSELLGLAPTTFQQVRQAGQKSRRDAEAMNAALFQATLGYYLEELISPPSASGDTMLNIQTIDALRDFFVRNVKGRGALPALRVGKQPYGILPVCDMDKLAYNKGQGLWHAQPYKNGTFQLPERFWGMLGYLFGKWEGIAAMEDPITKEKLVPSVGSLPTDLEKRSKQFMQIVGLQAHAQQLYLRQGLQYDATKVEAFQAANYATVYKWLNSSFDDLINGLNDSWDNWMFNLSTQPLKMRGFRFLKKQTLLDGPWAAAAEFPKNQPLPNELSVTVVSGNTVVTKPANYITWLRTVSLEALYKDAVEGTENFASARSLLYMLLRSAVLNQHWDAAMRIYEKVQLRDFRMDNLPLYWRKTYFERIWSTALWATVTDADYNFNFSDASILNANFYAANLSNKQRVAFTYFDVFGSSFKPANNLGNQHLSAIRNGDVIQRSKYRDFIVRFDENNNPSPWEKNPKETYITAKSRYPFLFFTLDKKADLDDKADVPVVKMSSFLRTASCQNTHFPAETAQMKDFFAQMDILAQVPVAELERLMAEHLDLCSHRLDAWLLGFANWRLAAQRQANPTGLYLGAYGYVENIKPASGPNQRSSNGYIHAPSLDQAVAAAVLRAGDVDAGNNTALRVNLSSARVRKALEALEGIRNGLSPEEALPSTEIKDAVGDLMMAESVYQLVRGNYDRAAAALDTIGKGLYPPDPEIVKTPRSGAMLTHRSGLCWGHSNIAPAGWPATLTPRALADPSFNYWLGSLLGDPAKIVFRCQPASKSPVEVRLNALGLQPIDLLVLATTNYRDPAGQLAMRIRSAAGQQSSRSDLQFDYTIPTAIFSPEAAFFLLQKIAALVHRSRALLPADWTHPAGNPANTATLDLAELRGRLKNLLDGFNKWQDEVTKAKAALEQGLQWHEIGKSLVTGGPKIKMPFPEQNYQQLFSLLQQAGLYGLPYQPALAAPTSTIANGRALQTQTTNLLAELNKRLTTFQAAKTQADNAALPEAQVLKQSREAAEALFGGPVLVAPILTLKSAKLKSAVADGNLPPASGTLRQAQRPLVIEDWLNGIARVRDNMNELESALLYADALLPDGPAKPRLSPAQLPYRANDNWVGVEIPPNYWVNHVPVPNASYPSGEEPHRKDKLSLVFAFPANFSTMAQCGGLLSDEWNETIPNTHQTTGIAFHYNQPNTAPPQNLLLAVHYNENEVGNQKWSMDSLFNCVLSAFRLAKIRAVDADMFISLQSKTDGSNTGFDAPAHMLPGAVLKVTDPNIEDDISVDFGANIDQRLFKLRGTAGGGSGGGTGTSGGGQK